MVRVPRYGTHDGIKYSPRRTLIYSCEQCGKYNIKTGRTDKLCEVCAINSTRQSKRQYEKKRIRSDEYRKKQAEHMRERRKNDPEYNKQQAEQQKIRRQNDPDYNIKQAQWQKNYFERNPDKYEQAGSRWSFSDAIRKLNNWYGYVLHHMLPVALFPEFAFEEWNMIPITYELHEEFHNITGGKRMAKYPRWWANDLVNFIYDEIQL